MTKRKHYSFGPICSYNAIYNLIAGARSIGKTFGAKEMGINNHLKRGEQFIYLRRHRKELVAAKETFFTDIAFKYPGYEFKVVGSKGYMRKAIDPDDYEDEKEYNKANKAAKWDIIAFFVALSTAQQMKSVAYPKVTMIIYDEFILEKGAIHYIPEEVNAFNNFYITVDRFQNRVKVFFIANSVSIMNPYFMEWDISPDEEREFVRRKNGVVVAHFPNSEDFANEVYETQFGKFIKDTEYGDFALGNQFKDNNDKLILVKGNKARYKFTLETYEGKFSVWYDYVTNQFFVQDKLPKEQVVYTLVIEDMDEDKTLVTTSDKTIAYLRSAFNTGRVMFDKPKTRNSFRAVFKR